METKYITLRLTKKDFISKKTTQARKLNGDIRNPRLRLMINKVLTGRF